MNTPEPRRAHTVPYELKVMVEGMYSLLVVMVGLFEGWKL